MVDNIILLLREYPEYADFGVGVSPKTIKDAELELGIIFPFDLKEYLEKLGWVDFGPHEFLGLGDVSHNLIEKTIKFRARRHLPDNYVVIADHDGDECVCLDTNVLSDQERVIIWDTAQRKVSRIRADSLYDFLESEIKSFIE